MTTKHYTYRITAHGKDWSSYVGMCQGEPDLGYESDTAETFESFEEAIVFAKWAQRLFRGVLFKVETTMIESFTYIDTSEVPR